MRVHGPGIELPTRRRRRARLRRWSAALLLVAALLPPLGFAAPAQAQGGNAITVDPHDLASGAALPTFQYIVNVDNSRLPEDADPALRTGIAATAMARTIPAIDWP